MFIALLESVLKSSALKCIFMIAIRSYIIKLFQPHRQRSRQLVRNCW